MVKVSFFKAYFTIVFLLCLHQFHTEAKQAPTYQVLPSTHTDYVPEGQPQHQRKDIGAEDKGHSFKSVKESENLESFQRGPTNNTKDTTEKEQIKTPKRDVFKGNLKSTPRLADSTVELTPTTSTLGDQINFIRSEISEPPERLADFEFGLNLSKINTSSLTPSFESSLSSLPTVPNLTTARDNTSNKPSKPAPKKTPKIASATLEAKPSKSSEGKSSLSALKFFSQNKLKMESSNGTASTVNNKHTNVDPKNIQRKFTSIHENKEKNQTKLNHVKLNQNNSRVTIQEGHTTSPTALPKERKTVIPLDNISDSLKKSQQKISPPSAKSADPESSECPSCGKNGLTQELVRARRIEMFREELMEKLRISPPTDLNSEHGFLSDGHPTSKTLPVIPPALLAETMAENSRELARDDFHARVQKVLIFGEEGVRDCPQGVICFSFPLKDRVKERVAEVKLWLLSPGVPHQPGAHNWTVWELHKGTVMESRPPLFSLTSTAGGWLSWNVTELVFDWLDSRADQGDLAVKCSSCLNGTDSFSSLKDYQPAIEVSYDTQASFQERRKRSVPCDPRSECCKQELEVDFHNISLSDRIVNPSSLSIGYCFGSCNNIHQISNNHTLWKHKHGQISNYELREKLKLCCVPLVLKDATVQVLDPNVGLAVLLVPKAIVETCGCL